MTIIRPAAAAVGGLSRTGRVFSSSSPSSSYYAALIRTHHITSRKKLQRVRKAAAQLSSPSYVLVRSGGAPGIMYAEATSESGVADWVAAVQGLRYKDFQCVQKPGPATSSGDGEEMVSRRAAAAAAAAAAGAVFEEVTSTTDFAARMQERGMLAWFKQGMGYT